MDERLATAIDGFDRLVQGGFPAGTVNLIAESPDAHALTAHGVEQFIADSFVHLGLEEVKGELRRTLTVRKMRFTKHDTAKHPMYITPKGLAVAADEKVV